MKYAARFLFLSRSILTIVERYLLGELSFALLSFFVIFILQFLLYFQLKRVVDRIEESC